MAGSTSTVRFRVRNTSPLSWEAEDVLPVRAHYRILAEDGKPVVVGERVLLQEQVPPFHDVMVVFDVAWPEEPGSYQLEADLVMEHVGFFFEEMGEPVLRQSVVVVAGEAALPSKPSPRE